MPKAPDDDSASLFDELLDLVPPELRQEFGEVFYSRAPQRRDWSGFEDDWREFGPGAVAFQRRVHHLLAACGIEGPRKVPASSVVFLRSTRIEALDRKRTQALLRDCWIAHERVISALGVRVVVCLGQATGQWVRALERARR